VSKGQAYFVVGTYDSSSDTATLYVDGAVVDSKVGASLAASSAPLDIGQLSTGENRYWGVIDEVSVFNSALDASQVASLYGAATCD